MNPDPMREPSADIRQAASAIFQIFNALLLEGFTERQALVVVGQILASGQNGGK